MGEEVKGVGVMKDEELNLILFIITEKVTRELKRGNEMVSVL